MQVGGIFLHNNAMLNKINGIWEVDNAGTIYRIVLTDEGLEVYSR